MELTYSKLKTSLTKNSFVFISSVVLFYLLIIKIPFDKFFSNFFNYEISKSTSRTIHGIIITVCCILSIKKFGLDKDAGIRLFHLNKPLLLLIPIVYPISLGINNIMELADKELKAIAIILPMIAMITKGIAEEITFRGLLQSYLINKYSAKLSIYKIVFITAGIFALMHIINISRYSFVDIINQIIGAFFFGVFFGAMVLKVKNIFVVGLLHGFVNFAFTSGSIGGSSPNETRYLHSISEIFVAIITYNLLLSPLLIVGIILLRKPNNKSAEI